jgi:type I restriction enzyme S subunit
MVQGSWLPANTNQAFAVVRPSRRSEVDPRYLLWVLRSDAIRARIAEINVQAAQANLSLEQVGDFELQVREPEEQRSIADILDHADALVAALERLISKKEAVRRGLMQELLTGTTRLPGYTDEWSSKRVPELVGRISTRPFKLTTSQYGTTGRVPIVDQGQRLVAGYASDGARSLSVGTRGVIVFGDHTCIVKFVDFDFAVGADGTQVLQAKPGNNARFLAYALQYRQIKSTGYNRHYRILNELEFHVPSENEQEAIASVIADVDAGITSLKSKRSKCEAIKRGMMQELLSGRTRLPVREAVAA